MKRQTALSEFLRAVVALSTLIAASPLRSRECEDTWIVGQTVATTSGNVEGHAAPDAVEVSEYLGIPYATPPMGTLRFQPPVELNRSSTVNGADFVSLHFYIFLLPLLLFPICAFPCFAINAFSLFVLFSDQILIRDSPVCNPAVAVEILILKARIA